MEPNQVADVEAFCLDLSAGRSEASAGPLESGGKVPGLWVLGACEGGESGGCGGVEGGKRGRAARGEAGVVLTVLLPG